MDRRNFLGFIPAIGATPFIAKEIIRETDLVIIKKPELITDPPKHTFKELLRGRLQIVVDDEVVSEGVLSTVSIKRSPIYHTPAHGGPMEIYELGPKQIDVTGVMHWLNI